jgi:hypothetical protein
MRGSGNWTARGAPDTLSRMPVLLEANALLPCPPAAAFALATDAARFPQFFAGCGPVPGLRAIHLDAPLAPGSTRRVEGRDGAVMTESIVAHEPPLRHAYVLSGLRAPLAWLVREGHADWRFESADGGTQVRWSYAFHLTTPLAWPLAAPLLKLFMQGAMRRCLAAMALACAAPVEAAT